MVSSAPSFLPKSKSRDDADRPVSSISSHCLIDAEETQCGPKNSHQLVQYRCSGQYYSNSTTVDRARQSMPKTYIPKIATTTAVSKSNPATITAAKGAAAAAAAVDIPDVYLPTCNSNLKPRCSLTLEEAIALEGPEGSHRQWLEDFLFKEIDENDDDSRSEDDDIGDLIVSSLVGDASNKPQDDADITATRTLDAQHTITLPRKAEAAAAPPPKGIPAMTTNPEESEASDDTSTKHKYLVQALRKLYHSGRRLRRRLENIKEDGDSFSTQAQDPNTQENEPGKPVIARLAKIPTRPLTLVSPISNDPQETTGISKSSSSSDSADTAGDSCEHENENENECYNNYYNGLETSEFYSEDLVVEWGSSYEKILSSWVEDNENETSSGSIGNYQTYWNDSEKGIDPVISSDFIKSKAVDAAVGSDATGLSWKKYGNKENKKRTHIDAFQY